jgi:hypothetical protein
VSSIREVILFPHLRPEAEDDDVDDVDDEGGENDIDVDEVGGA